MEQFLRIAAIVLLAVILGLSLGKQGKDWAILLTAAVSCMVLVVAATYLEPVVHFVKDLQALADLDGQMLEIVMKAVGIGLTAEIAGLICQDAGNASLGKGLQILATVMILWTSVPLMQEFLDLVQKVLGGV